MGTTGKTDTGQIFAEIFVVLTYSGGGLRRWEGAADIVIYLAFIGVIIAE